MRRTRLVSIGQGDDVQHSLAQLQREGEAVLKTSSFAVLLHCCVVTIADLIDS